MIVVFSYWLPWHWFFLLLNALWCVRIRGFPNGRDWLWWKLSLALVGRTWWCGYSPGARHPGVWSQVSHKKHYYEQSQRRWWNSRWVISNPKRWLCENDALDMSANLENLAVVPGLKRSVFIPSPKKGNAKECSNYHTIALISHASKVMLKILQARL